MKQLFVVVALVFNAIAAWAAHPVVELKTSLGTIVVELYEDKAPVTVDNFQQYVKDGFYNGTIFHRVIENFMVQGGGFDSKMVEKPTRARIKNEADNGLRNDTGTLAMARTPDPHSASAQFFINLKDNDFLNFREPSVRGFGYAVFGKVTSGFDVVQKMAKVETTNAGPHQNVPAKPIVIESARLLPAAK